MLGKLAETGCGSESTCSTASPTTRTSWRRPPEEGAARMPNFFHHLRGGEVSPTAQGLRHGPRRALAPERGRRGGVYLVRPAADGGRRCALAPATRASAGQLLLQKFSPSGVVTRSARTTGRRRRDAGDDDDLHRRSPARRPWWTERRRASAARSRCACAGGRQGRPRDPLRDS